MPSQVTFGLGESQVKGWPVKGSISVESQKSGFIGKNGLPRLLEAAPERREVKLPLPEASLQPVEVAGRLREAHLRLLEVKLQPVEVPLQLLEARLQLVEVKRWLLEAHLREHRRTLETLEVQLSLLEERLQAVEERPVKPVDTATTP